MILIIFKKINNLFFGGGGRGGGGEKWSILGPKKVHPQNFGSAVKMFCKFWTMERANR